MASFATSLSKAAERDELAVDNIDEAVSDLLGLWQGFLRIQLSFGEIPPPVGDELRPPCRPMRAPVHATLQHTRAIIYGTYRPVSIIRTIRLLYIPSGSRSALRPEHDGRHDDGFHCCRYYFVRSPRTGRGCGDRHHRQGATAHRCDANWPCSASCRCSVLVS